MRSPRVLLALAAVLGLAAGAHAQPAYRVADLAPAQAAGGLMACPSEHRAYVRAGALAFFPASDLVHGCELWATDGTPAGTRMVSDIHAGPWGSDPAELTAVGSTLYFLARDGVHGGSELWKSDGTTAGTLLVKELDLYVNAIGFLTVANGSLHFVGPDPANYAFKFQVWRSDGTAAGTVPVAGTSFTSVWNLVGTPSGFYFAASPGPSASQMYWSSASGVQNLASFVSLPYAPRPFAVGTTLYFAASAGSSGLELWTSDTTAAGTHIVEDIVPGSGSSNPGTTAGFAALGNVVLFDAAGALWRSDGTDGGTFAVSGAVGVSRLVAHGSRVWFTGTDVDHGNELWASDGTLAGTGLVKDIVDGPLGSVFGDAVLGGLSGGPLLFCASQQLWRSDGSAAGTLPVTALPGGLAARAPAVVIGSSLLFAGDGGSGLEPWLTDGTSAGTALLAEIAPDDGWSAPSWLVDVGGTLHFAALDANGNAKLYRTDGTTSGTSSISGTATSASAGPARVTAVAGHAWLTAPGASLTQPLFAVAGSSLTTIKSFQGDASLPTSLASEPPRLTECLACRDLGVFFSAHSDPRLRSLWHSDGTTAGTVALAGVDDPDGLTFSGATGETLFLAGSGAAGRELYAVASGGSPVLVKDIRPSGSSSPSHLVDAAGKLFFAADDGTTGVELWKSDGTSGGTVLVKNLGAGSANGLGAWASLPRPVVAAGATLYFAASDGASGVELWKSDGTAAGTVLVKDIRPGSGGSDPSWLTLVGSTLYFVADDGAAGPELWKSDGTAAGTVLVRDVLPGTTGAAPAELLALPPIVAFVADDGAHGRELWTSDGSAAGTLLVEDLNPGLATSAPGWLTRSGLRLYFAASDGSTGRELWAAPLESISGQSASVSFGFTPSSVAENAGSLVLPVVVTTSDGAPLRFPVSVSYVVNGGTATSGLDYLVPPPPLVLPAGLASGSSVSLTLSIVDDNQYEGDETLSLRLASPVGASLDSPNTVSLSILDDDSAPTLSVQDASLGEGNAGQQTGLISVALSNPSTQQVTVNYSTAAISASSGVDYLDASGTLTFVAGQTESSFAVQVLGDTLDENDETFGAHIAHAAGAGIARADAVATIADDDPPPALSLGDASVTEGNSGSVTATFTASLSAASSKPISVAWASAPGSATAGADYTSGSGTLTFAPGTTTRTLTIAVLGDTLDEDDETFVVDLGTPTNATLADGQGAGTIADDDPLPALSINDVSLAEGNSGTTNASFTVTLAPVSGRQVSVAFATASGTAGAPGDYTATSGTLTFAAGQTSKTISVPVVGDALDEDDETFVVNLGTPTNATLADGQGAGTITDDDPLPALSINDVSLAEGNSGTTNASFTVTLTPVSGRQVSVAFATTSGTAGAPGDYTATSGTLTFAAGQTSKTISVPVAGDALDEDDETFVVNLGTPTNATLADGQGAGTITDDDPLPALSINDVSLAEGNSGTTNASLTVTLTPVSGRQVSVAFATASGTAGAPGDYTATSGTLTFAAGQTSKTISVPVVGDALDEADEAFVVNLSAPGNATLADSQGSVTITDDDPLPALSAGDVSFTEGNSGTTNASLTVTLTPVSGRQVSVAFATASGTAGAPGDYTATSGTLTFAAGQTSGTISVPVVGDTLDEADETFVVNLSGATNATLGDAQGVVTITDDDPLPALAIADAVATERDGAGLSVTLTVSLAPVSGRSVSVAWATAPGTATAPGDYTTASGNLTFAAGETSKTLSVAVAGDLLPEPNETFAVNLSGATNATFADVSASVTIRDEDPAPADFGADGRSDVVIYRAGAWLPFDYQTGNPLTGVFTGQPLPTCIPAPGDFDGNGALEFSQLCGDKWYFYGPTGTLVKTVTPGGTGNDYPVPADYDGDGKDDVVVYRQGAWLTFSYQTGGLISGVFTGDPPPFTGSRSIPYPADFDGDGKADFSIYAGGPWHFYNADGSYKKGIWTGSIVGDIPIAGDYDGDGVDDVVVWRNGAWLWFDYASGLYNAANSVFTGAAPNASGGIDLPSPLDVDGDGKLDRTVYAGGPWHFYNSNGTYAKGIWCGAVAGQLPISRRPLP